MNIWIVIIEALIFATLFTVMVFVMASDKNKHQPGNIHNYPEDIQKEYFRTHEKVDVSYRSKNVILRKMLGIILFVIILALCSYFAGARTFKDAFVFTLGMMVFIGLYDTLFLDWVLFANMKRFRLEGTEHMDNEYHQKWFHLKGMLFPGSVFALVTALLSGIVIELVA